MEGDFRIGLWLVQPLLNTISAPGDTTTRVEPKVMDVLIYLAGNAGQVVCKERIIQVVWHGTFVGDDVLTGAISDLRHALKDHAKDPQYIQTIPKRGYRLIAAVSPLKTPAARYEELRLIGQGARGQVFLARDIELNRKVALKSLQGEGTQDPIARKRLFHEAQAAAALDHPFVCKIYDTGTIDGVTFIVMEYLDGRTLKERLREGPIELAEVFHLASEIAEALEAAHGRGIVHRDLKPSNIMLTAQNHVKIMDFGVAGRIRKPEDDPSDSSISMTNRYATPDTLPYFAPEQFRDSATGFTTDFFAFGLIIYEMVTGAHPFQRKNAMETGIAILNEDPAPLSRYLSAPPALLQHLIQKTLAKDPLQRYQGMHEVRTDLSSLIKEIESEDANHTAASTDLPIIPTPAAGNAQHMVSGRSRFVAGLAILAAIVAVAFLTYTYLDRTSLLVDDPPLHAVIKLQPGYRLGDIQTPKRTAMTLAQNDGFIVYTASPQNPADADKTKLFLRWTHSEEHIPISGTEGASVPFLSPDSSSIGFWADGQLKKVSIQGGEPKVLCAIAQPFGAAWGKDGTIVFAPGEEVGLSRIRDSGGKLETLTQPDKIRGECSHCLPSWLPGNKSLLFTVRSFTGDLNPKVAILNLLSLTWKIILEDASDARYASTGHLVFARRGKLFAIQFDPGKSKFIGDAFQVLADVMQFWDTRSKTGNVGAAQFSFSSSGALAYVPGEVQAVTEIVFIDNWFAELKTLFSNPKK